MEHGDFDSTFLISRYTNLATLFLGVILGWIPTTYHGRLPVWVGVSLSGAPFSLIVISPSYLVLRRLPCWVLSKLLRLRTIWVYPGLSLQRCPRLTTQPSLTCLNNSLPTERSVQTTIYVYNIYVIVCSDLSGNEPNRQVYVDKVIASGSLGSVMVMVLVLEWQKLSVQSLL